MRRLVRKLVCRALGHLWIKPSALHMMVEYFIDPKTDAVCLRCMKQDRALKEWVDLAMTESPVAKHVREKYKGSNSESEPEWRFEGPAKKGGE